VSRPIDPDAFDDRTDADEPADVDYDIDRAADREERRMRGDR
jgi:hypothetical protein